MPTPCRQRGFTLVELIMVIVIMGVIGGMVSVFMKHPIDAYLASARRAALTDVADTALRRIARDIHKALPNSILTSADGACVEFIPTKTGGRYRAFGAGALTAGATHFNMLGSNAQLPLDQRIQPGDVIVVANMGPSQPESDAYHGSNTAVVGAAALLSESGAPLETSIPIAPMPFPAVSYETSRFQVVPGDEKVVSYVCNGDLRRTVNATDFTPGCPSGGPILARNVRCTFTFDQQSSSDALLRISLQITEGDEAVSLWQEVHLSTSP